MLVESTGRIRHQYRLFIRDARLVYGLLGSGRRGGLWGERRCILEGAENIHTSNRTKDCELIPTAIAIEQSYVFQSRVAGPGPGHCELDTASGIPVGCCKAGVRLTCEYAREK
jgi:hypothetical protein